MNIKRAVVVLISVVIISGCAIYHRARAEVVVPITIKVKPAPCYFDRELNVVNLSPVGVTDFDHGSGMIAANLLDFRLLLQCPGGLKPYITVAGDQVGTGIFANTGTSTGVGFTLNLFSNHVVTGELTESLVVVGSRYYPSDPSWDGITVFSFRPYYQRISPVVTAGSFASAVTFTLGYD